MTTIQQASKWFELNNIPVISIDGVSLYLRTPEGFEIEISSEEISYRAELYLESEAQGVEYARTCSITGDGMNEGYCILDGDKYIKNHAVMVQHIKEDTNYASIEEAYDDGYYYYTSWE